MKRLLQSVVLASFCQFAAAADERKPLSVTIDHRLATPAAHAWQVLGRFCAISQWQSLVASCDVLERDSGIVRIVVMRDHSVFTEQLDEFSGRDMRFSYSLIAGPLPVQRYSMTFSIRPHSDPSASILRLHAVFTPADDKGAQLQQQLRGLFENGLKGIDTLIAQNRIVSSQPGVKP